MTKDELQELSKELGDAVKESFEGFNINDTDSSSEELKNLSVSLKNLTVIESELQHWDGQT